MKRLFDFSVSLILLLLLSVVIVIVALLVRVKIGSPILFHQERPGQYGRIFKLYKFRTMTDEKDLNGVVLPNEKRLTKFGATLRKSSLDELPQLINVLRGDISLVGPRPLLVEYLEIYTKEQARRHEVKPGITGWAQVNGRNSISWEEKFAFDIWYVENRNFWLDIKILCMTFSRVIKSEGVNKSNQIIVERFKGKP